MRAFAALFDALDTTTSTNAKVAAMAAYLRSAPHADAAWAVSFLTGQKIKRLIGTGVLRQWAMEIAAIEPWLFDECYAEVGDSAETITLLVAPGDSAAPGEDDITLAVWVEARLLPMRGLDPAAQRARVTQWWSTLPRAQVFLLCKLMTGGMRVGVSRTLVVRALAEVSGLQTTDIERRLMGAWAPSAAAYERLIAAASPGTETPAHQQEAALAAPYPFFLASPLESDPSDLGDPAAWRVEWKWDGIRGQLIRRGGRTFLWSRGEELVTERFPEIVAAAAQLPDGSVLDGEILAWDEAADKPAGFQTLQKRLGRLTVPAKLLREAPVVFVAYDLLEHNAIDLRTRPLTQRRALLDAMIEASTSTSVAASIPRLRLSHAVDATSWEQLALLRATSRERGVEGLMLKRLDSPYGVGRRVGLGGGDWWKWKIEPYTIDAVLIYAQPGSGKRANLLTDYTFAVWDKPPEAATSEPRAAFPPGGTAKLVPFAKAYSGLTNDEIAEVDRWIRTHTTERFGPVRAVEPLLVFELGFEAIGPSPRHQSGVAVRFPRILRRRTDKGPADADTLDTLRALAARPTPAGEPRTASREQGKA